MNDIASLYSQSQQGGELPYFVGKQYGTGWLRNLARIAFPILKRFGRAAVNTASDVIMRNKSILPSLKSHAIDAASSVLPQVSNIISSRLGGPSAKRAKTGINKRRKRLHGTIFSK
jgi:hypothetical protein